MIWNSIVTVVDIETGEVLTQKHVKQGLYVVVKKTYQTIKTNKYRDWETDRKSTRLNSSHLKLSRMPSSA